MMTPSLITGRSRPGVFFAAVAAILGFDSGLPRARGTRAETPRLPDHRVTPPEIALHAGSRRNAKRLAYLNRSTVRRKNPLRGICGYVPKVHASHIDLPTHI